MPTVPTIAPCPRCGVKRQVKPERKPGVCQDCRDVLRLRRRLKLKRYDDLTSAPDRALFQRYHDLSMHDTKMAIDPRYALDVMYGHLPEPRKDPWEPWDDLQAIDQELNQRGI